MTEEAQKGMDEFARLGKAVLELSAFKRDFEAFLDQTSDFIYFKDINSRFIFCSQSLAAVTGHRHWREMLGKHDREVFPPDTARFYEEEERSVFAEGKPLLHKIAPYYDGAGAKRYVLTNKWPLFDAEGKVSGIFGISRDITERLQAENELRIAAVAFETLQSMMVTDANRVILRVNRAFIEETGYSAEEIIGKTPRLLQSGRHGEAFYRAMWDEIHRTGGWQGEIWDKRKNGEIYPKWLSINAVRDAQGVVTHYVGSHLDVTERKRAELALQQSRAELQEAQRIAHVGSWQMDLATNHVYWSDELYRMQGLDPRTMPPDYDESARLFTPESWERLNTSLTRTVETGIPYELELEMVKPDGSHGWMLARGEAVRDAEQAIVGVRGVAADITERKQYERQIEHIAYHDALTSLPNRVLLADRLQQGMSQSLRRGQRLAVAYLDLDGFKSINDTYGHGIGDQLLIAVATRMKQALREGDTLARIGGDEFVAVLQDLNDAESGEPLLNRLLVAAAQPITVGEHILQVSGSLGVTFYPQADEVDADQLLRQADQAMYQAKLTGKNRYYLFDAAHDSTVRGHHESLEHIRRALAAGEFVLYYQPKVDLRSGQIIGAEALIRWQHPEQGLLPPGVFLPVIEEHPLAVEIGEWVIASALDQMERWRQGGLEVAVSVNVGAMQLQQSGFVEHLLKVLTAHPQVSPCHLEIEVLETSALEDITSASQVMAACAPIGVSFALDDFGTGYSSLTYLKRLPISQIKIDRSFVRDMTTDQNDAMLVQTIIDMAKNFRLKVIAEGVETQEQLLMLQQFGCMAYQGYYFSQPVPAEQFEALLKQNH